MVCARPARWPCAPSTATASVTHGPARAATDASAFAATRTAASTACSAINRYVVHFPPVTVTTPSPSSATTWSRETFSVPFSTPFSSSRGGVASGRIPDHTLSTSSLLAGAARYGATASRMNPTSSAEGRGASVTGAGASVVPARTPPSQGSRNTTRPSFVLGTIRPQVSGAKCAGSTTCVPPAGVMIASRLASTMRRTPSVNGPVALITQRARTGNGARALFRDPETSRTKAPVTRGVPVSLVDIPSVPSSLTSSNSKRSTRAWLSTVAPAALAVAASATARRASSNWPSRYTTAPFNALFSGSSDRVRARFGNAARLSRAVRNLDISRLPPPRNATRSYAFIPAQ